MKSLCYILMILLPVTGMSQEEVTLLPDSTELSQPTPNEGKFSMKTLFKGEPGKAFLYSLILPGLGQAKNKRYWKIPIVWAALGTSGYFIYDNSKQFNDFNDAYKSRIDFGEMSTDKYQGILSESQLDASRKYYRKNLQRSYIAVGLIYFLTAAEAFVDNHLMNFEVDDDLSFDIEWQPVSGDGPGLGLVCRF